MDCTSFGLSPCMPPIEDTRAQPVEIGQAPPSMTNQAPSVQTNLAPPLTTNRVPAVPSNLASTPISISPALPILTNEAPTTSASLGPTPVSNTIQIPHISSNQASTIPANLASARVSTVHAADDLARLGAHFSHTWNRQNHDIPIIPGLNYQHLLTTDILGMSPSTSWATSVQKTKTPILTTAPVSPIQVPHVRENLASPRWTSLPKPASTSQVPPLIAGIPPPFASTVAPSTSPIQPTHLHTGRSQPVMRNWTPPVQTASLLGRMPGSQRAFNSSYTLRSPSPHVHHFRPYISMSRPRAPPAPMPDHSYNVP